jgi:hypothetical protein
MTIYYRIHQIFHFISTVLLIGVCVLGGILSMIVASIAFPKTALVALGVFLAGILSAAVSEIAFSAHVSRHLKKVQGQ